MSGDAPNSHTTLVRSNDLHVTASISLGDLLYVRPYASWHDHGSLFEIRFKHGSADMSAETLTRIIREGQEALTAADAAARDGKSA